MSLFCTHVPVKQEIEVVYFLCLLIRGHRGWKLFQVNNGQKIRKHLGHVVLYREEHTHTHTHTYTIRG